MFSLVFFLFVFPLLSFCYLIKGKIIDRFNDDDDEERKEIIIRRRRIRRRERER